MAVTHAEALEDLVADARGSERRLFYFTSGSYSDSALACAERFDIALFTFDDAGVVSHANAAAVTAILTAPDVTAPDLTAPDASSQPQGPEAAHLGAASPDPDLRTWAASAWQARQAPVPGGAFLAYLPLGVSLLVGLLTLPIVRAWQTGAEPTLRPEAVVVPVLVFHAVCVWGCWQVARRRARLRRHRLHISRACSPPRRARALVDAAMQLSGRGIPHDREAFVLLRNEIIGLAGLHPFHAGVLLWEVTMGPARPADRHEWIGGPPGDGATVHPS